jgi:hypothetical protein
MRADQRGNQLLIVGVDNDRRFCACFWHWN